MTEKPKVICTCGTEVPMEDGHGNSNDEFIGKCPAQGCEKIWSAENITEVCDWEER